MNPLVFHGQKVYEDPQEFIDEMYKIVKMLEVSMGEKAELTSYQHSVAQVWFK